jgi:hypothetical protein
MAKNSLYSAVSFRYASSIATRKLNLSEEELVGDFDDRPSFGTGQHLGDGGSSVDENELRGQDIDRIMVGLVNRGLSRYDTSEKTMRTSLDEL